jgi:hypothetical protein
MLEASIYFGKAVGHLPGQSWPLHSSGESSPPRSIERWSPLEASTAWGCSCHNTCTVIQELSLLLFRKRNRGLETKLQTVESNTNITVGYCLFHLKKYDACVILLVAYFIFYNITHIILICILYYALYFRLRYIIGAHVKCMLYRQHGKTSSKSGQFLQVLSVTCLPLRTHRNWYGA